MRNPRKVVIPPKAPPFTQPGLVHGISCHGEDGTVEELNELLRELQGSC